MMGEDKIWETLPFEQRPQLAYRTSVVVANARIEAFEDQAYHFGELVQLGLISRGDAAEVLECCAIYNQLPFEYGQEQVQQIIANGLNLKVVA
jgi:hypothetical protein